MTARDLRKGWCPGALKPMPSGDGLLVRVRLTAGELPVATAIAIAALAARHGNGSIDLTRRANLQIRGLSETSLPALTHGLSELGLLDGSAEAESVRNVMVSPLAGLDAACADGRDIARQLEQRLAHEAALHELPPKFGFAIDGGGKWPLGETGADITLWSEGNAKPWRARLAGAKVQSQPLAAGNETSVVLTIAIALLASGLPRVRYWVLRDGAAAVLAAAGLAADAAPEKPRRSVAKAGALPSTGGAAVVAIGIPFGHLEAHQLARLAQAAGVGAVLRLTPWRLLAIPATDALTLARVVKTANAMDLGTTPGDPRLDIEACTGAPGCANATTFTRQDASRLAELKLPAYAGGPKIHVSGCQKGCAHSGNAAATLIGRDGAYDLVVKGGVRDAPSSRGIIGELLPEAVARELNKKGDAT